MSAPREEMLGEGGEIDAERLDPLVYDTIGHLYWHLGDAAGVAYHDGQLLVLSASGGGTLAGGLEETEFPLVISRRIRYNYYNLWA